MNVEVDADDEVNLIKDVRARSNACYKCGEMGHFQRDCKYDGDKPIDGQQEQEGSSDSYDPVVGKWMTNLVTTPINAMTHIMQFFITQFFCSRPLFIARFLSGIRDEKCCMCEWDH